MSRPEIVEGDVEPLLGVMGDESLKGSVVADGLLFRDFDDDISAVEAVFQKTRLCELDEKPGSAKTTGLILMK